MKIQILEDGRDPRKATELPIGTIIRFNDGGIWLISADTFKGCKMVTSLLYYISGSFNDLVLENYVEGKDFTVIGKMNFKE